jgi:protein SCO1/2
VRRRRFWILAVAAWVITPSTPLGAYDAYKRSVEGYVVPDVVLLNQDGARVRLVDLVRSDKTLVVDFFFTSCSTVCPVLSSTFAALQKQFAPGEEQPHLLSVAIDPEHDTPEILRGYRERFGAGPGWDLLTGSRDDIERLRKAFNAYTPNKMAHRPLNFLKAPGAAGWVRIDGLLSAAELRRELDLLRRGGGSGE